MPRVVLGTIIAMGALVLWAPSARLHLWMDEVITLAIAEQPVSEAIRLLERDGSPPLYYLLAKVWQALFGTSEVAVRSLPLSIAVVSASLGAIAMARRTDLRTGWILGALTVVTPGVAYYATEARPYSLLFGLGLCATVLLYDEVGAPDRRRRVVLAVVLATTCYTHNWGLFLTAGTLLALAVCYRGRFRARMATAGSVGIIVALLYLPWLMILLRQTSTTGAPWLAAPAHLEIVLGDLARIFGTATTALLVIGIVALGQRAVGSRSYDALLIQVGSTAALGWVFSMLVTPAFTYRYLMVVVAPLLVMLAISSSRSRLFGHAVLATGVLMGAFTAAVYVDRPIDYKSRAVEVAARVDAQRESGARVAVVAADMSLPAISYYVDDSLQNEVTFISFQGRASEPRILDWRDITDVMQRWQPRTALEPVLDDVDIVMFLHEQAPMRSNRVTDYWRARESALERASTTMATHPRLHAIDEWSHGEWLARVYVVDP